MQARGKHAVGNGLGVNIGKSCGRNIMDQDAFEIINIAGKEYKYPIGWDNFKKQFLEYFPGNEEVFDKYLSLV